MPAPHLSRRARRRVQIRRFIVQLPLLVWLVLVWMILWGWFSWATFFSGLIVGLIVVRLFPLPPVRLSGRFDLLRAITFLIWFIGQVIVGSFQVLWTALRYGRDTRNAVVEVPLRTHDDLIMTAVSHVASLIPGSLVLEVDRRHASLFLHVLNIPDEAAADRFRADVLAIERQLIYILGTQADIDKLRDEELSVAKENIAKARQADGWPARGVDHREEKS